MSSEYCLSETTLKSAETLIYIRPSKQIHCITHGDLNSDVRSLTQTFCVGSSWSLGKGVIKGSLLIQTMANSHCQFSNFNSCLSDIYETWARCLKASRPSYITS